LLSVCPRAQCYKTFYVRNLRMFVIIFVPGKPFQPSLMFVGNGKAKSLLLRRASFRCSTWVRSNLSHKHQARLEGLATDKRSSLLRTLINYGHRKFCTNGNHCQPSLTFSANARILPIKQDTIIETVCNCVYYDLYEHTKLNYSQILD
jgi:hypothetical protein